MIYVPKSLIEELEDLKQENNLQQHRPGVALIELVKYARIGREAERLWHFDFTKKKGYKKILDIGKM